ncbi:MAG: hypothetical protein AAF483_11525 [Planctomycetota bacterium]
MFRNFVLLSVVAVSSLFADSASAQQIRIRNDYQETFILEVRAAPRSKVFNTYVIRPGETSPKIYLFDPRRVDINIRTNGYYRAEVRSANLSGKGPVMELSEALTDSVGSLADGTQMYDLMRNNGFKASENEERYRKNLQNSEWRGRYQNNRFTKFQLNGSRGTAGNAQLTDLQYVISGDGTYYVLGNWQESHGRQHYSGRFQLQILPERGTFDGKWQDGRGPWRSADGVRIR